MASPVSPQQGIPDVDPRVLFVGSLSPSTNQQAFRSFWESFGPVEKCHILFHHTTRRSRCCGYVTFCNQTDALNVLSRAGNLTLHGQTLDVKIATPPGTRSTAPMETSFIAKRRLHVTGFPRTLTGVQFRKHWQQWGEVANSIVIINTKTGESKGIGYVTFADESIVSRILATQRDGPLLMFGRQITVHETHPHRPSGNQTIRGRGRGPRGRGRGYVPYTASRGRGGGYVPHKPPPPASRRGGYQASFAPFGIPDSSPPPAHSARAPVDGYLHHSSKGRSGYYAAKSAAPSESGNADSAFLEMKMKMQQLELAKDTLQSQLNVLQKQSEAEQEEESKSDLASIASVQREEACHKKFRQWLCNTVKLPQYLEVFQQNECNDVRMIEFLDASTLENDLAITNKLHRSLILKKSKQYVDEQKRFHDIVNASHALKPYASLFEKNGIWTMEHVQTDIRSEKHLAKMLKITDKQQAKLLWKMLQDPNAANMNEGHATEYLDNAY